MGPATAVAIRAGLVDQEPTRRDSSVTRGSARQAGSGGGRGGGRGSCESRKQQARLKGQPEVAPALLEFGLVRVVS